MTNSQKILLLKFITSDIISLVSSSVYKCEDAFFTYNISMVITNKQGRFYLAFNFNYLEKISNINVYRVTQDSISDVKFIPSSSVPLLHIDCMPNSIDCFDYFDCFLRFNARKKIVESFLNEHNVGLKVNKMDTCEINELYSKIEPSFFDYVSYKIKKLLKIK